MFVRQVSVFVQNTKGSLAAVMKTLQEGNVDLIALSIADTEDFGILRCITGDTDAAVKVLKEAGYTVKTTDVLALAVPDEPGGLWKALSLFDERGISVEYLYSFVRRLEGQALVIVRPDDRQAAVKAVQDAGSILLSEEQVHAL